MIFNAVIALWNVAIAPVVSTLAGLVPAPPAWVTTDLTPVETGLNYVGNFVCWPAFIGVATLVMAWRLAMPAYHLALRVLNVFTLGGFQR